MSPFVVFLFANMHRFPRESHSKKSILEKSIQDTSPSSIVISTSVNDVKRDSEGHQENFNKNPLHLNVSDNSISGSDCVSQSEHAHPSEYPLCCVELVYYNVIANIIASIIVLRTIILISSASNLNGSSFQYVSFHASQQVLVARSILVTRSSMSDTNATTQRIGKARRNKIPNTFLISLSPVVAEFL